VSRRVRLRDVVKDLLGCGKTQLSLGAMNGNQITCEIIAVLYLKVVLLLGESFLSIVYSLRV
jgi:hypothetical protein